MLCCQTNNFLTRVQFRESVFERDNYKCVFCKNTATEVHHLTERRLFEDGGYYIDNGISVCNLHHRQLESTDLSPQDGRDAAGIKNVILPPHLYSDQTYTKWGDICLPNGKRLRGELFFDPSVQKVIAAHLDKYSYIVKYPRTLHLPWSENMNSDDRQHQTMNQFHGRRVIVSLKRDGENCLDENTAIMTNKGEIKIKDICNNFSDIKIYSYNHKTETLEFQPIISTSVHSEDDDWYEIQTDNGLILRITGEHRIWIYNLQCYRKVKDLDGSEILLIYQ